MDPAAPSPTATLPCPLTSLVGRDAEVRSATRLLGLTQPAATARLVSLIGTAGSGKTRLAIAVGAAAPVPVRFVDLSTMDSTTGSTMASPDAAGFVLDALGAARRPDLDAADTLLEALGDGAGRGPARGGVRAGVPLRRPHPAGGPARRRRPGRSRAPPPGRAGT